MLQFANQNPAAGASGVAPAGETPLLEVRGLKKHFVKRSLLPWTSPSVIRAVDGVDLAVASRQTLGLVGESGCGKTTIGRLLVQLEEPTEGRIFLGGLDVSQLRGQALREHRRRIQMVFQDPSSSLDPRMRVRDSIAEPLSVQRVGTPQERRDRVSRLMEQVGLDPSLGARPPAQLSGGQRQRVGIARALALSPSIIVADEPTSALDVSVRAQVINLLRDLQDETGLSFIFISHDLSTVRHISDTIAVMYLGRIVEQAPTDRLFSQPLHPYTKALLAAVPVPNPVLEARRAEQLLAGELPSPSRPPAGCRFSTRCPLATPRCRQEEPALTEYEAGHYAACHYV